MPLSCLELLRAGGAGGGVRFATGTGSSSELLSSSDEELVSEELVSEGQGCPVDSALFSERSCEVASRVTPVDVEGVSGVVEECVPEGGPARRSSSKRLLCGGVCVWAASDGVPCEHVVDSMFRRAGTEGACLKSLIIRSVATIFWAYSSGWHIRSRAIKY